VQAQPGAGEVGGPRFLHRQLGMGVDVLAYPFEFGQQFL
jgi:hypothetical protein